MACRVDAGVVPIDSGRSSRGILVQSIGVVALVMKKRRTRPYTDHAIDEHKVWYIAADTAHDGE